MDHRCFAGRAYRGVRPVAISLMLASTCVAPALGDDAKKKPLKLAFHVDVLKDHAEREAEDKVEGPAAPTAMEFIGLPLTFGERDAAIDRGPGVEAGLYAGYETKLDDRLSLSAVASLAKTKYLSDGWGTDVARAETKWRYGDNDLALNFEPSWRVTVTEAEIVAHDYGAALRLETGLADGLRMVNGLRYGVHDATALGDDWSTGTASTALAYRFGKHASLNVAFDATYTLSKENGRKVTNIDDLADVASSFGPVVAMSFPISDEIEFAGSFRYCRSTDELPRFSSDARQSEDSQHLDLRATWHNRDPMIRAFDISAGYAFDHLDTTEQDAETLAHAVTLALAVNF
ncbi:MAG: hypothetical protein HYU58_03525 [Proteobacteria bacterium]|nr:hypothetical protein [Pseudomonadota bacterium]